MEATRRKKVEKYCLSQRKATNRFLTDISQSHWLMLSEGCYTSDGVHCCHRNGIGQINHVPPYVFQETGFDISETATIGNQNSCRLF